LVTASNSGCSCSRAHVLASSQAGGHLTSLLTAVSRNFWEEEEEEEEEQEQEQESGEVVGQGTISPVLDVPRQCPFVLLVEVTHMIGINF
jgi:hypothetical protein